MEDVMDLRPKRTIRAVLLCSEQSGSCVGPHVDPDVAGLLIDDERLDGVSQRLQALLPADLVLRCWDEERWRQQDQLQALLPPVHDDRPGTDTHS